MNEYELRINEGTVVPDAVVVILIEKLRKLRSVQEVCGPLEGKVACLISKLQKVYWFLKDECWKESYLGWIDRLLRALYQAEDRIDIFMCRMVELEQETFRIFPDVLMMLGWKCSLFQGMNHFNKVVDRLLKDQLLINWDAKSASRPSEGCLQHYERWHKVNAIQEDPSDIGARANAWTGVTNRLLNGGSDLRGVVILGDEGSGKTWLARRIFNRPKIKNHFECRAWVHISRALTIDDIMYEVLKQVKGSNRVLKNMKPTDQEEMNHAIVRELSDKRYLIVLDNFDDVDTWYDFIQYLPDWSNGSRVLISTRSRYTASTVDLDLPIKLESLQKTDSKQLLQKKMNPIKDGQQYEEIISQIFNTGRNHPLLIDLLGGLFMDPNHRQLNIKDVSLHHLLFLSYNSLPPEEKPCFLYLTLFPRAAPVPVRRIVRLWLGEGFLTDLEMNPEDQGEKYLEDLILRNLVEVVSWKPDGAPKACQAVTSAYDMFRPQAIKLNLLHIHDQEPSEPSRTELFRFRGQLNIRRLVVHSNITSFCHSSFYPICHVRSFISLYSRWGVITKDLGKFLRNLASSNNFRLLRVLDLEGVYRPYLPTTIKRLVQLRYLGLRSTVLDSLPDSVGDLPQLETLDIKDTHITSLPPSLWKSYFLRHLYLNEFLADLSILKRYSSSRFLSNLQTLTGLYIGNFDEGLAESLTASVTTLTKLKINYQSSDSDESIARWISKLTDLRSLKLGLIAKDRAPSLSLPDLKFRFNNHPHLFNLYLLGKLPKVEEDQLPSCLRVLTLSKSELSIDPMRSLGRLQHLRSLRLLSNSYTGHEMICLENDFISLQVLKIWSLTKLHILTVQEGCMSSLKELEIRDCTELISDKVIGLNHLRSLEELVLSKMPKKFVHDTRESKLPNTCCVFEYCSYEPAATLTVEQIKGGKEDEKAIIQPQQDHPHKDDVGSRRWSPVTTQTIPQVVHHSEGPSQTPLRQNSHSEEEPPQSIIPTTTKDVLPSVTHTGPGGVNPFALL